ncbi:MAG: hypothetical protein ACLTDR_15615 [Adlercreutzia equolifaciens]
MWASRACTARCSGGALQVFPIFHPAAALYDSKKREALENDFATLGELLRGEV